MKIGAAIIYEKILKKIANARLYNDKESKAITIAKTKALNLIKRYGLPLEPLTPFCDRIRKKAN